MFRRGTKSVESNSRLSASPLIAAQTKAKPAATDRIKGRGCERLPPSRRLVGETQKTLKTLGLDPMVITSDTHMNHVKTGIIDFMNHAEDAGEILLITWNAYVDLPYLNRRQNWRVIIDEVPQVDRFYGPRLPRNLSFLTEHIDIEDSAVNDRVATVRIKDRAVLEERMEAVRDDVEELFREFFRDLLSPNKDMFVDLDSWNRLVEQGEFSDDENLNRLFFISMLRPEAFSDAILLGANVADSLVYHWLTRFHGYRFVEHGAIASQLRPFPKNTGSRLKISYFIPRREPPRVCRRPFCLSHAAMAGSSSCA